MKKVNKSSPMSKIKGHQIEEVINTSCGLSVFKMKKEEPVDLIKLIDNNVECVATPNGRYLKRSQVIELVEKFMSDSAQSTPGEEDFLDYWWKKWPASTRNLKNLERSAHFRGCRDAWFAAKKVESTP